MSNGDEPKKINPNLKLAKFLVNLAVDDNLRATFNQDAPLPPKEAALDALPVKDKLSDSDREILLGRTFQSVFDRLVFNQQNT